MEAHRPASEYAFFDLQPAQSAELEELVAGLRQPEKRVSPKFFYDETGSRLFDEITELEEYYLTRTEMALFDHYHDQIAEALQGTARGSCLVEYGSGSSYKVRKLLETLRPAAYLPVDISADHLQVAARKLHDDYPWLRMYPTCADFTQAFELPEVVAGLDRTGFFPGSSIGNFEPQSAVEFLVNAARTLGFGGRLLIGVDLKKDTAVLEAAYNDRSGVTARFNLNLLEHLNSRYSAGFEVENFSHHAAYNEREGCIQMFLESQSAQTVNVAGEQIQFAAGERMHTENSYKYSPEEFASIAQSGGFHVARRWQDERDWFCVFLLEVASQRA
jgi:dimethylhistidine N-methyltransferase